MAFIGHFSQHGARYILASFVHCSQHGARYILASIVHCSQRGARYIPASIVHCSQHAASYILYLTTFLTPTVNILLLERCYGEIIQI